MYTASHPLDGKVLYQIYPRSFRDENGDGVGDLKGITRKLDYLRGGDKSLNVDVIWISPFFTSPMADFGYDVSDYCDVDPLFGTLDDFKELLKEAHARGLEVLIDFVPNHTSDEHEWFKEARASRDNPKRDWYIWRDARADGSPPNNWQSVFGGSAWQWEEATGQYYLHSFHAKQPDLNWENPEVQQAIAEAMRFWLDMGIDGFRVDAVSWMAKDPSYGDDPIRIADGKEYIEQVYGKNGPRLFDYLSMIADVVASYEKKFMVVEAWLPEWTNMAGYDEYYRKINAAVCAPFNFSPILAPWEASRFKSMTDGFLEGVEPGDLPVFCFSNHDQSRIASRIGVDEARAAAVLQLTLPGLAIMYYGDELGMIDRAIPRDQVQDPANGGLGGRDPERTPMPWDDSQFGGFSEVKPWLPLGDISMENVANQWERPHSMLSLYRELLNLRRDNPAIHKGDYRPIRTPSQVFGYTRQSGGVTVTVLVNFSAEFITYEDADLSGEVILATHSRDTDGVHARIELGPREALIIEHR